MIRPLTIDLDSADYTPAVTALEWAFANARRLGYSLPGGFDVALRLLKNEARTSFYVSSGKDGFFSLVQRDEDGDGVETDEAFDAFMAMLTIRATRLTKRREEAYQAAAVIGEFALALGAPPPTGSPATLSCADCGKPRAKGSASRCRACYASRAAYAKEIEAAANA